MLKLNEKGRPPAIYKFVLQLRKHLRSEKNETQNWLSEKINFQQYRFIAVWYTPEKNVKIKLKSHELENSNRQKGECKMIETP